jgi:hypothetical protein
VVSRGLLLAVRGNEARGVGQFGLPVDGGEAGVRQLSIPLDEPSVLADAVHRKETYIGPLDDAAGNAALLEQIGGGRPSAVLVVPMVVAGSVAMLFYGDNAADGRPIGASGDLARSVIEASLAMEKEALEERQRDFELRYKR